MRSQSGLLLRPQAYDDRVRLLELMGDPDELAFGLPAFVPEVTSLDEVDERITRSRAAHESGRPSTLTVAAIDDPQRLLGMVSWRLDVPEPLATADVGYAVHPDARRRGVARGGLALLVRWLTEERAMARVQLDHSVENVASCRTAFGAGLEQEGVRRSYLPLRDPAAPNGVRRHDVCLHGVVTATLPSAPGDG